jgi:hypothetical protein
VETSGCGNEFLGFVYDFVGVPGVVLQLPKINDTVFEIGIYKVEPCQAEVRALLA